MKSENKKIIKSFKLAINDLMDNFEKYNAEEKAQIRELFEKVSELNIILDKYDIESDFSWDEYCTYVSRYFGVS
jgi:hypothetical protein